MFSKVSPMKVTASTVRRMSINRGIDKVYERARDHCQNLSLFQQWYEIKLAAIAAMCDELWLLEQMVLHSPLGETYHSQAPLILAVAYFRASEKINNMGANPSASATSKSLRKEQTNPILKPFQDVLSLAAKACLLVSDKSKCALGKEEYATMTVSERKEMQQEQFARILHFFCSAQDEFLYEPDKPLMDNIVRDLVKIAARKWPPKTKNRHVSFKLPRLNGRGREAPPNTEAAGLICKLARNQALLAELIKDNEDVLKCFFLERNEALTLCSKDHLLPSNLLRCLYRMVTDILWDKFQADYFQSCFHVKVIARYRNNPSRFKLSSKALLELRIRYEAIKDIEQRYLDDLLSRCKAISSAVAQKFTKDCMCGSMFHIEVQADADN